MDLSKAINDSINKMSDSGKTQEMIDAAAESMIKSIISDSFSWQSPIYKEVKEAINGALNVDLTQVDFSKHNTAMIHAISEAFKDQMLGVQTEQMKQKIASMFSAPEKTEYTITEFINAICSQIKHYDHGDLDEDTEVSVKVKSGICGWQVDLQVGERHRDESINVSFVIRNGSKHEGSNKIFIIHRPQINLGASGGFEQWLYQCYSHGVTITGCESFNEDDCDLTVWEYNEDED